MTKVTYRKIMKKWKRSFLEEKRAEILGSWLIYAFKNITVLKAENMFSIMKALKSQSEQFTDKSIMIQEDPFIKWYLSKDWFASVLVQALEATAGEELIQLIEDLGWNYKEVLKPSFSRRACLEVLHIDGILVGGKTEITIKLETKGDIPVGTDWESSTGRIWEIIGNKNGYCEMGDIKGNIIFRNEKDILKNFKKLNTLTASIQKLKEFNHV